MAMRVLQLSGEDRSFLNFRYAWSKAVLDRGIDIVVAAPNTGSGDEIVKGGFKYSNYPIERGSFNPLGLWKSIVAIRELLRSVKPQILQAYSLKVSFLAAIACYFERPPTEIYIFTGMGTLFTSRNPALFVLRYLFLILAKGIFRHGRVYAMNEEDLSLVKRWRLGRSQHLLASEGVDLKKFSFRPFDKSKITKVAFVGRFLKAKGVLALVKVFQRLRAQFPRVELHLFGEIDAANANSISTAELESIRREPGIFVHGFTRDVAGALGSVDAIVLPTIYREGLPASLLEAAACGTICVASDMSGCKAFIEDRRTGFLVEKGNDASLERTLAQLIDTDMGLAQIALNARRKAEEMFSSSAVAGMWESVFTMGDAQSRIESNV